MDLLPYRCPICDSLGAGKYMTVHLQNAHGNQWLYVLLYRIINDLEQYRPGGNDE